MALTILKNANLALSFSLELCVLVALGYWGFQIGQGTIAKIGLGIGAPMVAMVVWALFGAPKSAWRLQGPWFLILRVVFFGSAAVALFTAGQRVLGMAFALVFVLNCTLIYALAQ
ncbi:MAG: YrdB family protein [Ktedonobacteraceae bacterium]